VGGRIFDRAMAGWDVTVFVPDLHDVRPLRILGAHADDYGSAVASARDTWPWLSQPRRTTAMRRFMSWSKQMLDEGSCEVAI